MAGTNWHPCRQPQQCWRWPGHGSGISPLHGGPVPWAAVELLALLMPCRADRDTVLLPRLPMDYLCFTSVQQLSEYELNQYDI